MRSSTLLSQKYFLSDETESFDSVAMEVHRGDEPDNYVQLSGNFKLSLGGGLSAHEWMISGYPDDDAVEMAERIARALGEIAAVQEALDVYAVTATRELQILLGEVLGMPIAEADVAA
jgi:hypothetical protein